MNQRLRAAFVIARRQALETVLSPGLYVTASLGLLLGYLLVSAFTRSVDSAGFNASLSPIYDVLSRLLGGLFGSAFVAKLFAQGPFLLALVCSFLPVLLFLGINSVFRFGLEKSAGAIELLLYGPADETSYLLASFLKDALFSAAALLLAAGFLAVGALLGNLMLGPLFLLSLPLFFVLSLAVFAYGAFCSAVASNASAALAAFLGALILFAAILAGTLSISSSSVRSVSSVVAAALQWVSPFYYAALSLKATQAGSVPGFLGGLALLIVLAVLLLVASQALMRRKGVRA